MSNKSLGMVIATGMAIGLGGCAVGTIDDPLTKPATLLGLTKSGYKLETIPKARNIIDVAVYQIRDKTGQTKTSEGYADVSRAVTQAGEDILIDVLKKAGSGNWFRVYERTGLKDILQERKIYDVRSQKTLQARHRGAIYSKPSDQQYVFNSVVERQDEVARAEQEIADARLRVAKAERAIAQLQQKAAKQAQIRAAKGKPFIVNTELLQAQRNRNDAITEVKEAQGTLSVARAQHANAKTNYQNASKGLSRAVKKTRDAVDLIKYKKEYIKEQARRLPPLKKANLVIQGAIVGYDVDEITGGLGARLLSIGAQKKYRRDVVTISLRAVDVRTGEVMSSVTTAKTVYSSLLQSSAFSYVAIDKLLEIEGGIARNEPPSLAVRAAMELAVFSLIVEGAKKGVWKFANADAQNTIIDYYDYRYQAKRSGRGKELFFRDEPPWDTSQIMSSNHSYK